MHWSLWLSSLALASIHVTSGATLQEREPTLAEISRRYTKRTPGGIHLPIIAREQSSALARRGIASAIGLGDAVDVAYTVLMTVGGIASPLILDTGSSDLWIISDACTQGCDGDVPVYPQASFKYSGLDVDMAYGDSSTGTFASGKIGEDAVELAGIKLNNQYFAAINRTNTSVADVGAAGIFGLGFPINSVIWNNVFTDMYQAGKLSRRADEEETPLDHAKLKLGSPFPNTQFRRTKFPTLPGVISRTRHAARQTRDVITSALASYGSLGPFLARLVADGTLSEPMFSVTLQRDTIDVGGNQGTLSIGELPTDVSSSNMTWVPLRAYTEAEGGLQSPPSSKEVYPIAWEVMLDGVYFDGQKLPNSSLSPSTVKLSALIDTGNSLLRGPADIVSNIIRSIGNTFPCSEPHTLAFEIGGKMFPVDPRDFISQAFVNNVQLCSANLVATDPPQVGGYQFSWSLGTPFLKGVLSAYYYGNLSFPSVDQPKMGFLSTVPSDANQKLADAVAAATKAGKNFPAVTEAAPSGTVTPALTNAGKVTTATARTSANAARGVRRVDGAGALSALLATAVAACLVPFVL